MRTRCPLAAVVLLFFSLPPQSHAQHATPNNVQFAPPIFIHYPGSYPQAIASGDYNNDGIPDLVVGAEYGDAAVKLGRGNGTFRPWWSGIGTHMSGISPTQLVVADFNHDGKPDIATIKAGDSTIRILLNTTQFPPPQSH